MSTTPRTNRWPSYTNTLELELEVKDKRIAELEKDIEFYKKSMVRIAELFDITSPLQIIAHAEDSEDTYADALIRIIKKHLAMKG